MYFGADHPTTTLLTLDPKLISSRIITTHKKARKALISLPPISPGPQCGYIASRESRDVPLHVKVDSGNVLSSPVVAAP